MLSKIQMALYWREWAACKVVRKARGLCATDEARHALHAQALGMDKSTKDLTNRDFDRILAIFRTFSRPDDLNAQLRAEDQPEVRKEVSIAQAYEVLDELNLLGKEFKGEDARERYLNGTAWAIFKRPVRDLDDEESAKLCGVLRRQLLRMQKAARSKERLDANTEHVGGGQPF
jgi:hypothetical protein